LYLGPFVEVSTLSPLGFRGISGTLRRSGDSTPPRADHGKRFGETFALLSYKLDDGFRQPLACPRGESYQDDTGRRAPFRIDELSEILVFAQENALFSKREGNDRRVIGPGGDVRDRLDVVTGGAQCADDAEIATLIR
jgi:hypothetical protein